MLNDFAELPAAIKHDIDAERVVIKLTQAEQLAGQLTAFLKSVIPATDSVRERMLLARLVENSQHYFHYLGTMHDHEGLANF